MEQDIQTSNGISNLATAISAAQGKIKAAVKDSRNPFFKSNYADLASIWEACRAALSENGLSVVQIPERIDGELVLRTLLLHSSGEKLESIMPLPIKQDANAQDIGAALTYMRRYSLAAMAGVAAEDDDDGNTISKPITFWDRQSYRLPNPTKGAENEWIETFKNGLAKAPNRGAVKKYLADNQSVIDKFASEVTADLVEACDRKSNDFGDEP